ncbi:Tyrosine recombinase XerD [compost metagenome]
MEVAAKLIPVGSTTRVSIPDLTPDERLIARFIERAKVRSTSTARVYEQAIRRFMAWHGDPLMRVQYDHVLAYQATTKEEGGLKGFAPATMARHVMTLKSLFAFAVDLGYLDRNPTKQATIPTAAASPQTFVTASEMNRMITQAQKALNGFAKGWSYVQARRNLALVMLACTTGCRSAELAGLNWSDLFLDPNGLIGATIRGKGGRTRVVKILPQAWQCLQAYRRSIALPDAIDLQEAGPIFRNRHGDRLSEKGNTRIIAAIAKAAGLGKCVTPHAVRRGVATAALKNGASLRLVQAQLGHASLNTTQRYLYDLEGLRETAADYLGEACWALADQGLVSNS